MQYNIFRLIFTIVVAFLVSYAATPVVKILATKIGAIDVPKDSRRMHSKPIPRVGGLAIFYGFIVAILCFCEIDKSVRGILIGSTIIVALGVIDDVKELKAIYKLIIQIFAASIIVMHGIRIEYFTNPNIFGAEQYISLGIWSIPVTILWIVGVTNAVNLIDGLDGLAVGVSTISAVTLLVISIMTNQITLAILAAAVVGGCFGFLPYNMFPASIFMGDTGATFLGFLLSCVSIMGLFKGYAVISFAIPFLILALPIFDTGFAIIRRISKGQSPMTADRGHLHHRLIDLGFNQKQTVIILCIASALLSLSAVVLLLSGPFRAIILIISVIILTTTALKLLTQIRSEVEVNEDE